jgi:peptide/nickel transport system permease protein
LLRFALRRTALVIPTLFGMSVLVFLMVRLLPGDVANVLTGGDVGATAASREAVRKALGLNRSLPDQYLRWIGGMLHGDFGASFITGRPAVDVIGAALPITLELTLLATLMAVVIGVPLGVASATRPNSRRDFGLRTVSLLGLSVPDFWLATLILLLTSVEFAWTPPVIWSPLLQHPVANLTGAFIPAAILGVFMLSSIMRMTRTTMVEVLRQDYVRTARAKGLTRRRVVYHHALRNALIPVVSLTGVQIAALLGGATILETIFGYPGVGYTLTHAIYNRDYPLIQASAIVLAAIVVFLNLAIDLTYTVLDPRVKQE